VTTIERTREDSMLLANGIIFTIKELHDNNVHYFNQKRADAMRRFCQPEIAAFSMQLLELSFGLAALAVHAAKLQEAAESDEYAKKFWSSTTIN